MARAYNKRKQANYIDRISIGFVARGFIPVGSHSGPLHPGQRYALERGGAAFR